MYNVVCLYHGALWFDHRMTAHPQWDVRRVGEWGSCASSIFVGSWLVLILIRYPSPSSKRHNLMLACMKYIMGWKKNTKKKWAKCRVVLNIHFPLFRMDKLLVSHRAALSLDKTYGSLKRSLVQRKWCITHPFWFFSPIWKDRAGLYLVCSSSGWSVLHRNSVAISHRVVPCTVFLPLANSFFQWCFCGCRRGRWPCLRFWSIKRQLETGQVQAESINGPFVGHSTPFFTNW